jgi:hypothetical protein
MRVQVLARTIAWVAIVAVVLLALTGPNIPAWLLITAVVGALALGIPASVKQKRVERDAIRRIWRERQRSGSS